MTSEQIKKICIVGCGAIAKVHAKQLREKAELHVVSRRRSTAEAFCATYGGAAVHDTYEQALDSDIDGVVICTPPEYHVEQSIAALERDKGVLVEKPLCTEQGELSTLQEAVAAHPEVPFLVAENYYYKPSVKLLQSIIAQGLIGAPQSIRVRKCFTQTATGWKSGYGSLLEGGIHFIALISALTGRDPQRVSAQFPGHLVGQPERCSQLKLDYDDGLEAELHYAWNAFSPTKGLFQHAYVDGDKGRIVFECNGLYVRLRAQTHSRLYAPNLRDLMGYAAQTRDFLRCLHDRTQTPVSGFAQAQRDLNIVFQAYTALQEKS